MIEPSDSRSSRLTYAGIFRFWIPLGAMWIMMAGEQPLVAAFIARMPEAQRNLAAYGVIVSVVMLIDSPVIMLLTAGTALSKGLVSYKRLMRFAHLMIAALSCLHVAIGVTPLFDLIFIRAVKIPIEIVGLSRGAFLLMIPWTAAIGYRRLWQGVLIRFQRTGTVTLIIAARLITSTTLLVAGLRVQRIPGVYVAAGALSAGVVVAAVVAFVFTVPIVRNKLEDTEEVPISQQGLRRFYIPLALTSLILIASRPVITIGLSRLPGSLASLAVWPVAFSVIFLGTSIATSYQEVVIALMKGRQSLDRLRVFSILLFVGLLAPFLLFVLTPLARIWYTRVAGLTAELAVLSIAVTGILTILPPVGVLISWQRSMLIIAGLTTAITRSVILNIAVFVGLLVVLSRFLQVAGAVTAAIAFSAAVICEWLYIRYHAVRVSGQLESQFTPGAEGSLPVENRS